MKSKILFLLSIFIMVLLIALKYITGLPFNDYVMTIILLILAMFSGYTLCSITDKPTGDKS
ncbi:MAG: hypothetical protein ACJA0H_000340 [Francisellaceae bacterium]|jgi:hypothetical protein